MTRVVYKEENRYYKSLQNEAVSEKELTMNNKDYDVVALGELLIDFTPYGKSEQGHDILEANPGGAPCNVLSMVSKLGGKTAFLGKVGDDHYGHYLEEVARECRIDTQGVLFDPKYFTTLAFVHLDDTGDRSFSFARKPGADMMYLKEEVRTDIIDKALIFHYSTVPMSREPERSTVHFAVEHAKQSGCILSFDPNIRTFLWDDMNEAIAEMKYGLSMCDILKISEEELVLAAGVEDIEKGVEILHQQYPNIRLFLATLGKKGCYYKLGDIKGMQGTFTTVKTIDTTGAGDTFIGCCLYRIAAQGGLDFTETSLAAMIRHANAAASLITTRRGAMRVVPGSKEIEDLLRQN